MKIWPLRITIPAQPCALPLCQSFSTAHITINDTLLRLLAPYAVSGVCGVRGDGQPAVWRIRTTCAAAAARIILPQSSQFLHTC